MTPIFGEEATANYVAPAISNAQLAYNHFNKAVNYPIAALSPYFSAHSLSKISESVVGPVIQLENLTLPSELQPP